jgi:hypothetical protein
MLRETKELRGFKLRAHDGDIGSVQEFYFDDQTWTVRYLVADTGSWLIERSVLISPYSLGLAIEEDHVIPVDLTKDQIERSPRIASHEPVSRQFEVDFYSFYGLPINGYGRHRLPHSSVVDPGGQASSRADRSKNPWDPHLRSTRDLTGYHVHAKDGAFGHISGFIIDDETWVIRYLIVDTKNWWPAKHVLICPEWIESISWDDWQVHVGLTCEVIRAAPPYLIDLLDRDYEAKVYAHYDKPGYWLEKQAAKDLS